MKPVDQQLYVRHQKTEGNEGHKKTWKKSRD